VDENARLYRSDLYGGTKNNGGEKVFFSRNSRIYINIRRVVERYVRAGGRKIEFSSSAFQCTCVALRDAWLTADDADGHPPLRSGAVIAAAAAAALSRESCLLALLAARPCYPSGSKVDASKIVSFVGASDERRPVNNTPSH